MQPSVSQLIRRNDTRVNFMQACKACKSDKSISARITASANCFINL